MLITYEEDPARLVGLCRFLNVGAVQLHADIPPESLAGIKALAPLFIIKSYVVGRESSGPEAFARAYSPVCDAFITDTFDPATGASGAAGTGQVHDWAVSAELVRRSPRPVILAGGLNPANVRRAILAVRPADVHAGVEGPDGSKDPRLVTPPSCRPPGPDSPRYHRLIPFRLIHSRTMRRSTLTMSCTTW